MCYIFEKGKDNIAVDIETQGGTVSSELASDNYLRPKIVTKGFRFPSKAWKE